MHTNRACRISDRREVVRPIPLLKQAQQTKKTIGESRLRRQNGVESLQPFPQAPRQRRFVGVRHAAELVVAVDAAPGLPERFKWTRSKEIAAGVMPEMREACPKVSGREAASFCCTSFESPRTD